jgi:hypothetical protein
MEKQQQISIFLPRSLIGLKLLHRRMLIIQCWVAYSCTHEQRSYQQPSTSPNSRFKARKRNSCMQQHDNTIAQCAPHRMPCQRRPRP